MFMEKAKYTGYHGTNKDAADRIKNTNFQLSRQGWLGTGVYFFEENIERALDWAHFACKGKIPVVLEAILEVPTEEIFDTTRDNHEKEFHDFRNALVETNIERNKFRVKAHNDADFDGKVYNAIAHVRNSSLIRAKTFTQPTKERGHSVPKSRVPNAVELCLKNTKYVKSKDKAILPPKEGLI